MSNKTQIGIFKSPGAYEIRTGSYSEQNLSISQEDKGKLYCVITRGTTYLPGILIIYRQGKNKGKTIRISNERNPTDSGLHQAAERAAKEIFGEDITLKDFSKST